VPPAARAQQRFVMRLWLNHEMSRLNVCTTHGQDLLASKARSQVRGV
jgi:hypothetical protein